jgi:phosphatidylglycerol:prolipoprotein diacylglycerol transferase
MHPVLFEIFGKEIRSYGVMAALGFLAAILTWTWLGRRENRPDGFAADLGFWLMASGIVGSRLAYVAANWSYYQSAPLEILRIDHGGLIFYGGLLLRRGAGRLCAPPPPAAVAHADFAIPGLPSVTPSDASAAS